MQIETKSALAFKIIGRIFVTDLLILLVTYVFCFLLNELNLNGFSTTLFIVGVLTIIIAYFFGKDPALDPRSVRLAGGSASRKVPEGSLSFLITTGIAGVIAIALSIMVPLIFSK